jgi:hypothetical protein
MLWVRFSFTGLARKIEERFLRCATRQFRRAKLKKKRRAASVGMTDLGGWLENCQINWNSVADAGTRENRKDFVSLCWENYVRSEKKAFFRG